MNPGLFIKVELRQFGKNKSEGIIHVENQCSKKRETESLSASNPSLEHKSPNTPVSPPAQSALWCIQSPFCLPLLGGKVLVKNGSNLFTLVSLMPIIGALVEVQEMFVDFKWTEVKQNKLRENQLHFPHLSTVPAVTLHLLNFSSSGSRTEKSHSNFKRWGDHQREKQKPRTNLRKTQTKWIWETTGLSLSKSGRACWHLPSAPGSEDKNPIPVGIKLHLLHTAGNLIFTAWSDLPNYYCWDSLRRQLWRVGRKKPCPLLPQAWVIPFPFPWLSPNSCNCDSLYFIRGSLWPGKF